MRRSRKRSQKQERKSGGEARFSPLNIVNLKEETGVIGSTFLGYKTKNINQLWRWDTLEDVVFK
jgi:hypothetical protein